MDDLLVISAYYNYFDSPYLLENRHRAVDRLRDQGIRVITMEAALQDRPFVLDKEPDSFQCRCHSPLWQKERLINIALQITNGWSKYIAWIDADVILADGWVELTLDRLKVYPLVQLFDFVDYLDKDGKVDVSIPGFAGLMRRERFQPNFKKACESNHGIAWAARGSIAQVGIYDRMVSCGSDTLFCLTISDLREVALRQMRQEPETLGLLVNENIARDHEGWDANFRNWLSTESHSISPIDWFSYLPGFRVNHLFHGSYKRRNYVSRHRILYENEFDPRDDLYLNRDGLLEWGTEKPILHRSLRQMLINNGSMLRF